MYENMKEGQTLGFDGRTVNSKEGQRIEKKLSEKKFADKPVKITYRQDLAQKVWTERPALPANEVIVLSEKISGRSMADKLKEVRESIRKAGAAYLLISKLDDLMWLLNIRGNDIACNPVALSYGFVTPDEMYYFIQSKEVTKEFAAYAKANGVAIKDYGEIADFLENYEYKGKVLLDERNINYALWKGLGAKAEYVNGENPTERMKAIKNETERKRMEEVYRKDSVALIKFIYWLKKNIGKMEITEVSAAEYLDDLRRKTDGFMDLSFPTISAYKENAAMMHYEATPQSHKVLEADGMLLVDSGGQYMGGTTDVTRTIVLGEISSEIKKHFTLVAAGIAADRCQVFTDVPEEIWIFWQDSHSGISA